MKHIVVLSGAGISAESGLRTFRDSDGLWENYRIEDVATPEAWHKDPALVLDFYNQRRVQLLTAKPNKGHLALVELERSYQVTIITQNVDDLHERAGSSTVIHLHGELRKSRSTLNPKLIYDIDGWSLNLGDKCELGSQLRPHIVWFGEMVPELERAAEIVSAADIIIVTGTSLAVYPAARLIDYTPFDCRKYIIDPKAPRVHSSFRVIQQTAGDGIPSLVEELLC